MQQLVATPQAAAQLGGHSLIQEQHPYGLQGIRGPQALLGQ